MKKHLIIGLVILVLVAGMVSALTITDAQLSTKTNQQIKDTLLDTLTLDHHIIDTDDNRVYLYYNSKTIEPNGEDWEVKNITIRTVLPIDHIRYCFNEGRTNSECKNGLIYAFGQYYAGQYTDNNEDGIVQEEEKTYHNTVYQQLKDKLTSNYNKIIAYRDEAQDTVSSDLTSGIEENPGITI